VTANTAYQHMLVSGINISFCHYYSKAPGVFVSCKISCVCSVAMFFKGTFEISAVTQTYDDRYGRSGSNRIR